ncbi:MAG: hypothetical protein GY851_09245 [bacterium]|nr:hypothetical protein [bacterium]
MGSVSSNVIFAIGATGASKAVGQFAMVGAAIYKVGQAVVSAYKDAEKFRMAFERLSDQQIDGVMAMDKATAGFMDTMGLLQVQVKATEMGLDQNNKAMEAMAKVSLDISRKLGEGPDAMIARLNKLVEGVGKGTTRSLKEFGLDLSTALRDAGKSTEDMAAAQDMALKMVIDRAQELSDVVGAENMREGFDRLNNDIDTTIGLMWGSITNTGGGLAGAFDAVHAAMGTVNDLMMSPTTKDAMQEYIWSVQGIADAWTTTAQMILAGAGAIDSSSNAFLQNIAMIKGEGQAKAAGRAQGAMELEQMKALGMIPSATPAAGKKAPKKKRGGGGGKRKTETAEQFDMEFSLAESMESEQADLLGGEIDAKQQEWAMRSMTWEQTMAEQRLDAEWMVYEKKVELIEAVETRRVTAGETALGIEQQHIDASLHIWEQGLAGKSELLGGFFGTMAKGMEVFGKKGHRAAKAMMIGEATMASANAAIKAYSAMAGIPYVGPALGIAAAAAAAAFGAAQIKAISKQKYGQTSSLSGGGGYGGGVGGPSGPGSTVTGIGNQGGAPVVVVNVEGSLSHAITDIKTEYGNKVDSGEWNGWGGEDN